MQAQGLVRPMFEGPVDVIGDIHGEIDALRQLLFRLGYNDAGEHPHGRKLIFVGDLCDRGPDSPAVIALVRKLVETGRAQCVAGNHELNLLRRDQKHGNHWFYEGDHTHHLKTFGHSVTATRAEAEEISAFFETLPVALERADLRVVHAAWIPAAIQACRSWDGSLLEAYDEFDRHAAKTPEYQRLSAAAEAEEPAFRTATRGDQEPPLFPGTAAYDEYYQMSNPIRVLTSGVERPTKRPFFVSGKWRFVERVKWWLEYADDAPVIFGHYWRWWDPASHLLFSKGEPQLFSDDDPCGWHRNSAGREVAFCVDDSAGARFKQRVEGSTTWFHGRLAALRWPEREVVFDEDSP